MAEHLTSFRALTSWLLGQRLLVYCVLYICSAQRATLSKLVQPHKKALLVEVVPTGCALDGLV